MRDLRRLSVDPGRRADIIRYNAVRGDFGPGDVDELVTERIDEIVLLRQREVEREYRDGRRLLIRYTPVPDRGLLVTYSDVTHARAVERNLRENGSAIPSSAKPSPRVFTIGTSKAVDRRASEFTEFAIRLPRMHAAPPAEAAA